MDWLDEILGLVTDYGSDAADEAVDLGGTAVDLGGTATDLGGTAADLGGTVADLSADYDFGGGTEWFVDTVTGELVTAEQAQAISDLDFSGSGSGPVGDIMGPQNYDWDAASLGETGPGFATPGQIDATTPFNASSGIDWTKLLAQGLKSGLKGALGSLGSGSGALGAGSRAGGGGSRGALDTPSIPVLGATDARIGAPGVADVFRVGAPGMADYARVGAPGGADYTRAGAPSAADYARVGVPGGADYARASGGLDAPRSGAMEGGLGMGLQGGISALLSRLQADPGARAALQAAIDPGPVPRLPFTSSPPITAPAAPMASPAMPRMSGMQKLLLERFG
jgi:hypothetical protein